MKSLFHRRTIFQTNCEPSPGAERVQSSVATAVSAFPSGECDAGDPQHGPSTVLADVHFLRGAQSAFVAGAVFADHVGVTLARPRASSGPLPVATDTRPRAVVPTGIGRSSRPSGARRYNRTSAGWVASTSALPNLPSMVTMRGGAAAAARGGSPPAPGTTFRPMDTRTAGNSRESKEVGSLILVARMFVVGD